MRYTIGGFLDEAVIDYRNEGNGDLVIAWWFGATFRRMAEQSNHWAILDRQTIFALTSKYSILLFQHFASFANSTARPQRRSPSPAPHVAGSAGRQAREVRQPEP